MRVHGTHVDILQGYSKAKHGETQIKGKIEQSSDLSHWCLEDNRTPGADSASHVTFQPGPMTSCRKAEAAAVPNLVLIFRGDIYAITLDPGFKSSQLHDSITDGSVQHPFN